MKWKKVSRLSTVLWIAGITFTMIYLPLFVENGKLDTIDKRIILGVIIVMIFVAVVSSINLTSDGGKKITKKSVVGALIFHLISNDGAVIIRSYLKH